MCGCVICKFIGSVFSYIVSAPAGAVLAHTTTCHAGETIYLYMCFLCVSICVYMFLSEQACAAEGLNGPAPARAHP